MPEEHVDVHLCASYSSILEAVICCEKEQVPVRLVSVEADIFAILRRAENVTEGTLLLRLGQYMRELWNFLGIRSSLREAETRIKNAATIRHVFVYCTLMNPALIALAGRLSKKYPATYISCDARYTNSNLSEKCSGWRLLVRSVLFRLATGVPVEFVRPWAPVMRITEDFISSHFEICPQADITPIEIRNNSLALAMMAKPSAAKFLWLFIDHAKKHKLTPEASNLFHETWAEMVRRVSEFIPRSLQAIKAHPDTGKDLPDYFSGIAILDPKEPVELIPLPELRAVIGSNSTSMAFFARMPGVSVGACPRIVPLPPHAKDQNIKAAEHHERTAGQKFVHFSSLQDIDKWASGLHLTEPPKME